MALLSPGIQLFESSVTPPSIVASASNGVATLGFSTRGPVNKLTKVSSVSEFAEVFGDPIKEFPYAHIMAQAVLANNTDVYFMRLVDKDNAANAACPVIDFDIKGAKVAVKDNIAADEIGYFMAKWSKKNSSDSFSTPQGTPLFRIMVEDPNDSDNYLIADTKMNFAATGFSPAGSEAKDILYVSIADVISSLNANGFGDYFKFTQANKVNDLAEGNDAEIGLILSAKNEMLYNNEAFKVYVGIGSIDAAANNFSRWGGDLPGSVEDLENVATDLPTELNTGNFYGAELRTTSSISEFGEDSIKDYNHFELSAKYPGQSMNGIKVVKTTNTSVNKVSTWTVTVYDGETVLESRSGITPANLLEEMSKFTYIEMVDEACVTGTWSWKDGTWELGKGELLSNGDHWDTSYEDGSILYEVVLGKDGFPTVEIDGNKEYSESKAINLYLNALGDDDFVNTDEFSFSILATPGIQNTMVQNEAINVCGKRGDAIYLADVPRTYCEDRQGIDETVEWANGNSGFQSSYCAIYYGWFYQTNPYDTDNSIACPASCFIAPKMVALDQSMGEFYAPAGIARGGIICSDWTYSPDQKDRDKLVGNDNVVNPISYSNTRGVVVMAQKTTDRTTSPLNRVGIRRMTNMIKRNLRSRLVALLFEPNNEISRARARTIVDNVMAGLRSAECIETYDINVVSGTGANRNDLNVYLSFAPYGLIEKIYVYLSITDAGVEVSETVA